MLCIVYAIPISSHWLTILLRANCSANILCNAANYTLGNLKVNKKCGPKSLWSFFNLSKEMRIS